MEALEEDTGTEDTEETMEALEEDTGLQGAEEDMDTEDTVTEEATAEGTEEGMGALTKVVLKAVLEEDPEPECRENFVSSQPKKKKYLRFA